MRDSYSLGRIAGVRIGLNWSVLLLLALLIWTLARSVFPDANPGLGDNTYFAMAVAAALAFFASILLHELGHAVQARRDGMQIDGITLWLFGGVARFAGMFPSPGAEFRIAIAGPLVSAALGGGFIGLAYVPGLPEAAGAVCAWLGVINLALLAFNLLPALPLDGGRMLRAALWRWKGDLQSATRLAAGGGRIISFVLIGLGIALFILQGTFSGLWFAIIGWFLLQASAAEARVIMRGADPLAGKRVSDLMVRDPVTAVPHETLAAFVERIAWGQRFGAYPVVEAGRAVGIMPLQALAQVPRAEWHTRRVGDCMLHLDHLPTLSAEDDLGAAVTALRSSGIGRALVLDGERLVGLLSLSDVARAVA
ncbi:MAG TPA: site-2 protease family protein [Miltoncostaeaceae bacterium]|nr:site-2 protease family protein [Miltoncostaeaceae bacterium]